jgi:hypothetical protein
MSICSDIFNALYGWAVRRLVEMAYSTAWYFTPDSVKWAHFWRCSCRLQFSLTGPEAEPTGQNVANVTFAPILVKVGKSENNKTVVRYDHAQAIPYYRSLKWFHHKSAGGIGIDYQQEYAGGGQGCMQR